MSFILSTAILSDTTCKALEHLRKTVGNYSHRQDWEVASDLLTIESLVDIERACLAHDDTKTARAAEAVRIAREGKVDGVIPNFKAFKPMLEMFLTTDLIDGWVYRRRDDGLLYPYLVTEIRYTDDLNRRGQSADPEVRIRLCAFTNDRSSDLKRMHVASDTVTFKPQDVSRRRLSDALAAEGLFKETAELKADHLAAMERHQTTVAPYFASQFRFTGATLDASREYGRRGVKFENRKVVHDLHASEIGAMKSSVESTLFKNADGVGPIPEHPVVEVFDVKSHGSMWVNSGMLTPYVYDKSLGDKLVLPTSHRDLLDVLTSDLEAFLGDIVEGKTAGNIVLCKGVPGVGKTLTAEIYAELIGAPLYSIHTGTLGTSAKVIEERLQEVFARCKRWDHKVVLLLDEADVFVMQRGDDVNRNAIVAEFLRVLEYFDGLMFLTTNRPNDIDDAIISRCAAIVNYAPPDAEHAAAIWKVMAENFKAPIDDALVDQLLQLFPTITPRDIKMLFRLALRVSAKHQEPLSLDLFRRCAMFRAIEMHAEAA